MPQGYRTSRWDSLPAVREVRNTDGEVLRKVVVPAAVFLPKTVVRETGVRRDMSGRVVSRTLGPSARRYDRYNGECLCRVAGSERCPVVGHARTRDIPPPPEWAILDGAQAPSGVRLRKKQAK